MKNIINVPSIFCIFAVVLLVIASYMDSVNFWNAVIGIIASILTALATAWAIIKFYLEKRIDDVSFKQHMTDFEKQVAEFKGQMLEFTKEDKEFKNKTSYCLTAFTKDLKEINKKLDAQNRVFDKQAEAISRHETAIVRLDERTKKLR